MRVDVSEAKTGFDVETAAYAVLAARASFAAAQAATALSESELLLAAPADIRLAAR